MSELGDTTKPPPAGSRLLFPELWPPLAQAATVIAITTLVAYHRTFSAPFIFDDLPGIVRNPAIRQLWPPGAVLLPSQVNGTDVVVPPLVNLSLALNHAMGGLDVHGYHAVNLLLHIAAGVLLFAVLHRTFALSGAEGFAQRPPRARFGAAAFPLALGAALLWSLHPLQTASVTHIIQRAESLMALCVFFTLYAFIRATHCHPLDDKPSRRREVAWLAVSVMACLAGMAGQTVMVVGPVIVLLYDRTFVAGSCFAALRARWHYYLALTATWLLPVWLAAASAARSGSYSIEGKVFPADHVLTQCAAIIRYLALAVWPRSLVFDYGTTPVTSFAAVWPQALLLLALMAAVAVALRCAPAVGFPGACFFVILAWSSGVAPWSAETIAEHRMYLPLAALVTAFVGGLYAWVGRRGLVVGALALAVLCGGLTLRRNETYASALTLWGDTVAKVPANARAHFHLANAFSAAGRAADAVAEYDAALRLEPGNPAAHANLAGTLLQLGRENDAVPHYERALRLEPNSVDLHLNFAAALIRLGRMPEAVAHYEAAARLGLLAGEEHRRFGRALAEIGRLDEALGQLAEAVRLNPADAETHVVLGMVLSAAGRGPEALRHFLRAVELKPADAGAHCALGDALLEAHRPAEALPHYETALRLEPGRAAVIHTSMGNAFIRVGRVSEAIAHYEAALRLNPNDAEARANLAQVRAGALRRGVLKK